MKIDEEKLIDEFIMLLHMPMPNLKSALFHKVEEFKHIFNYEIQQYYGFNGIEEFKAKVKNANSQSYRFELKKLKDQWTVSIPNKEGCDTSSLVPEAVMDHIRQRETVPGVIYMAKIEIGGKLFQVSFEKNSAEYYSGSITKKESEGKSPSYRECSGEITGSSIPLQAGTVEKTEDFKTLLSYLLKYEQFYDHILKEFTKKWKPLLDMRKLNKVS